MPRWWIAGGFMLPAGLLTGLATGGVSRGWAGLLLCVVGCYAVARLGLDMDRALDEVGAPR